MIQKHFEVVKMTNKSFVSKKENIANSKLSISNYSKYNFLMHLVKYIFSYSLSLTFFLKQKVDRNESQLNLTFFQTNFSAL